MQESLPELLPTGNKQRCAVAMKSLMAAFAFGEVILTGVTSLYDNRNARKVEGAEVGAEVGAEAGAEAGAGAGSNEKKSIPWTTVIGTVYTALDFAFSYVYGYECYSPMEPDEEYKDKDYTKKLKTVNDITKVYTYLWFTKSIISIYDGIISCVAEIQGFEEKSKKNLSCLNGFVSIIMCTSSLALEIAGDAIADKVNADNTSFSDEKIDKKIYLCDTSGYIIDDVKSIMDALYELPYVGDAIKKNPKVKLAYAGVRAAMGVGYGISMALPASYINKTLK